MTRGFGLESRPTRTCVKPHQNRGAGGGRGGGNTGVRVCTLYVRVNDKLIWAETRQARSA